MSPAFPSPSLLPLYPGRPFGEEEKRPEEGKREKKKGEKGGKGKATSLSASSLLFILFLAAAVLGNPCGGGEKKNIEGARKKNKGERKWTPLRRLSDHFWSYPYISP